MELKVMTIDALSKMIRDQRILQGLTQQELADLSGVSVRFLGNLERGKESCEFARVLLVTSTLGIILTATSPGGRDEA